MSTILAYFFSMLIIVSALRVVTCIKPVYALLAMIICLLSISGLFFVAGAYFAGAVEIVVYAGAIMILFVFVFMMLNLGESTYAAEADLFSPKAWGLPAAAATLIFIALVLALIQGDTGLMVNSATVTPKQVGISLYGPYVLLVETGAFILLAALVAAYHIAKKDNTENQNNPEENTNGSH